VSLVVRIIAPTGRDAPLLHAALRENGIESTVSKSFSELFEEAKTHPLGPLLIGEEALTPQLVALLRGFLLDQPAWSDLPVLIVLRAPRANDRQPNRTNGDQVLSFARPVYLERPLHPSTLISSVSAALRARGRQYENRDALAERDAALAELKQERAALIRSEKLAAVGRLAASISHEINNPLEAVTNLLYLAAASENLDPDVRQFLAVADDELRRVSQIVAHTLRFHRQSTAPRLITPRELLEPTLGIYRGRLDNSSIRLELEHLDEIPVLCMEGDIRQVLNNLIGNAIDSMRNGGTLRVRTHGTCLWSSGSPVPAVRITVADTGYGITPASRAHLFEPFFTTKGVNGTGLGLWISQGIVQKHDGLLQVRSSTKEGASGTAFSILLPRTPSFQNA
jgi:signal transduction histidine kinase